MQVVQGNVSDIQQLIVNSGNEDDAIRLAKAHIERTKHTPLKQQLDALDQHKLIEVMRYVLNRLDQQGQLGSS